MTCPETDRTSAFLDGELDEAAAEAAEAHIAGCEHCQAFVETAAAASEALHAPQGRFTAPAALRARIARDLDAEQAVRPYAAGRRAFWRGAISGAVASGLAAAVVLMAILPPQPATLVGALADDHVHALETGRTIAAPFTTHHTLKPWFAGRTPVSPPVVDFSAQGYALVGGRVDRVAGAKTAILAYRHGLHQLDLYVWAERGGTLPSAQLRHGYRMAFWRTGDLDFAAVSDMQPNEFDDFVRLIRAVPE